MYENEKFDNFYEAINNLMNSKLVFANSYISELLHSIADNDDIYNLIARCMINFDFIEQWQISVSSGRLVLPEEDMKKIAFIFCMLNNIDDKNLDLNRILEHYYTYLVDIHPFEIFKREIVEVFRDLIFKELNITIQNEDNNFETQNYSNLDSYANYDGTENNTVNFNQSAENYQPIENITENQPLNQQLAISEIDSKLEEQEDLDKMLSIVLEMKTQIRKMKRLKGTKISKIDLIALVSTLEFAIKTNASEYFYGLVLSIKYLVMPMRNLKKLSERLEQISNKIIRS